MRGLPFLSGACLALLAAASPALADGAGTHTVPGIVFPDCHPCPAALPVAGQSGKLAGAPANYTPGARYEMSLETVPYRGSASRFALWVVAGRQGASGGTLEALDPAARVMNFSEFPNSSEMPQLRDLSILTYTRPWLGPSASWRFAWTAPPPGAGWVAFRFFTMSGRDDGMVRMDAWRLQEVVIPETGAPGHPAPSPAPPAESLPGLEPFLPPPLPSATPARSPGFELPAALTGLALAAAWSARRRGSS